VKDNVQPTAHSILLKRYCFCLTLAITAVIFLPLPASAQTDNAAAPQSESVNRTSADENFELNITERRITERDFAASTTVEAGEETARGLLLRVGVAVGAEQITLLLRNVQGRVRFRATLDRVLKLLNSRHAPSAVP
jgi:hypothetical protein